MSISVSPVEGTLPSFLPNNSEGPLVRRADRVLLVGCLLVGSQLLGPIGLVILIVGLLLLRRCLLYTSTLMANAIYYTAYGWKTEDPCRAAG